MIKIFGTPWESISHHQAMAKRVSISEGSATLLKRALRVVDPTTRVLDVGRSSRDGFPALTQRAASVETLDIAVYDNYPDIQFDLCDSLPQDLVARYDLIYCSAVLEHVYDPFAAARNLLQMLAEGGRIFGYVPWMFPYHGGDTTYRDYWRFSPDALGVLFGQAQSIETFATRGRMTTAVMVASYRWKSVVEFRIPKLAGKLNGVATAGRHRWHSSGYDFVVHK